MGTERSGLGERGSESSGDRGGPVRALRRALRRVGAYRRLRRLGGWVTRPLRIARLYLIYRKDLTVPVQLFRARVPIEVTEARAEEIEAVAGLNRGAGEALPSLYRQRIERGFRCFVARSGGRLVAYNWLTTKSLVDFDGESIQLGDGEIFCLDAFTIEALRGNAIHTELLSRMLEWAKNEGFRTAYTEVSAIMRRSWKTHQRLEWELTGRVLHVRGVLGLRPRLWRLTGSAHPVAGLERGYEGW